MERRTLIAAFLLIALALSGCGARQYESKEARAVLSVGRERMEVWISVNCAQGRLVSTENAVRKLPGGNEYLLPCIKGELSDGKRNRDFLFNLQRNRVYLAPDDEAYEAFQKECLSYTLECLGMEELSRKEDDEGKDAFFYLSLITEMTESDPEYGLTWGIDGYSASEYVKLPGELVFFGESIRDYIRNPDRGDVVCVELEAEIPDDVMLTSYTTERVKAIEEEYGLYFVKLDLETGTEEIYITWENNERSVRYSSK